jgi:putative transposase
MMIAETLPSGMTERLACKVRNLCRNTVRSARQQLSFIGPQEPPYAAEKTPDNPRP